MPVSFGCERCAIQDRVNKAAFYILCAPRSRYDVMVVEVSILGNISAHPIARALEDQEIEYAVVNRRATLRFLPKVQIFEPICKLDNQSGFCGVVFDPSLHIVEVARAR